MQLARPTAYRFATFDGPQNLKEAACRLAFDDEPQLGFVFCSVGDYIEANMKGEKAKIAESWGPGFFYLMPDAYAARGQLHAMNPGEGWTAPPYLYEQAVVRRG